MFRRDDTETSEQPWANLGKRKRETVALRRQCTESGVLSETGSVES